MKGAADFEVIIVGTGFGGMGAAIQLEKLGIKSFVMLDRADDLGGTWHLNTYPGIAVDIPSITYSYSFEPNPYWSRMYAPGRELKAYAEHVASKYNLRPHMRFNCNVLQTSFDEQKKIWLVEIEGKKSLTARILILATGYLSQPKTPDIPGLDTFAGKVIHTARWDHTHDLVGRRAAVIGTGATAAQLLPTIAPKLAQMYSYQRTPIWVWPKVDPEIKQPVQNLFARLPLTQRMLRMGNASLLELVMVTGALHGRQLPFMSRYMEEVCTAHLYRQVHDPVLREKLLPAYRFGCKRPTFSNDYFTTFTRPNVELITDPIVQIEADGIRTRDGSKREIDTLILATGYKVWEKGNFPPFPVHGKNGVELGDWWNENRYQAYEGITIPGFPNLFNLPSPYSFTGLSYFFTIEGQMKHMDRCIREMWRQKAHTFEVDRAANDEYLADMRQRMTNSVFQGGGCAGSNSYYVNQHGDVAMGRPMPTLLTLWRAGHYPLTDYHFA